MDSPRWLDSPRPSEAQETSLCLSPIPVRFREREPDLPDASRPSFLLPLAVAGRRLVHQPRLGAGIWNAQPASVERPRYWLAYPHGRVDFAKPRHPAHGFVLEPDDSPVVCLGVAVRYRG